MKIFRPFLPIAVLLCVCQLVFPQTFVIQEKPRALLVVDDTGKVIASIPGEARYPLFEREDRGFVFSQSSHTLYVRNLGGKSKESHRVLNVVNPATGHVNQELTLGEGLDSRLLMSKDGRRLVSYTGVSRVVGASGGLGSGALVRFLQPPFDPKIAVIDTTSNQVIATYEPLPAFRDTVPEKKDNWFFSSDLLTTADGGHVIVLCEAYVVRMVGSDKPRYLAQQIQVFSGLSSKPLFTIDPGGQVLHWAVTEDGRFLLVVALGEEDKERRAILHVVRLDTGASMKPDINGFKMAMLSQDSRLLFVAAQSKKGFGILDVVDLETGKVSERPLIDRPTRFVRLGSKQGLWVTNSQEMRPISETGELGEKAILLNKPRKKEEQDTDAESVFLEGYPGETISLGEDHAAMLIAVAKGGTTHRVALLDLKQLQVDSIVRTMTAGEASKIRAENMALGFAALGIPGVSGPLLSAAFLTLGFNNELFAARPDGKLLYALDTDSHEVTVIDVQAGTVLNRLPVDHSITRFQLTADGKHLLCLGKQIQKINLDSNRLED